MLRKKYFTTAIAAAFAASVELFIWASLPVRAAEFVPPNVGAPRGRVGGGTRGGSSPFDSVEPGAPGRRIGGGSRGCSVRGDGIGNRELTALVPETTMGLTVASFPSFFWYLPPTSSTEVEFVLMDENGEKVIYETRFRTKGEAGIVSLNLPENASLPPLEMDKNYRWYFSMICNPDDRAADLYVQGWIRRVEPNAALTEELATAASDLDRVRIYARNGIWHESVTLLASLRRTNPTDREVENEWKELIESVSLDSVADASLVQEVTLQPEVEEPPTQSERMDEEEINVSSSNR